MFHRPAAERRLHRSPPDEHDTEPRREDRPEREAAMSDLSDENEALEPPVTAAQFSLRATLRLVAAAALFFGLGLHLGYGLPLYALILFLIAWSKDPGMPRRR